MDYDNNSIPQRTLQVESLGPGQRLPIYHCGDEPFPRSEQVEGRAKSKKVASQRVGTRNEVNSRLLLQVQYGQYDWSELTSNCVLNLNKSEKFDTFLVFSLDHTTKSVWHNSQIINAESISQFHTFPLFCIKL